MLPYWAARPLLYGRYRITEVYGRYRIKEVCVKTMTRIEEKGAGHVKQEI